MSISGKRHCFIHQYKREMKCLFLNHDVICTHTPRPFTTKLQSSKTRTRVSIFFSLAIGYMCLVGSFAASGKNYHIGSALSSTMKLSYIYIGLQNDLINRNLPVPMLLTYPYSTRAEHILSIIIYSYV